MRKRPIFFLLIIIFLIIQNFKKFLTSITFSIKFTAIFTTFPFLAQKKDPLLSTFDNKNILKSFLKLQKLSHLYPSDCDIFYFRFIF